MTSRTREIAVLRDLAHRVTEAAAQPKYAERIELWTEHNSLVPTRTPVLVNCGRYAAYEYELIRYECVDPLYRDIEFQLRHKLFKDWIDDDSILHPWVQIRVPNADPGWGVKTTRIESPIGIEGAYKLASDAAITPYEDVRRTMRRPKHSIDERAAAGLVERANDAIGDILTVHEDRTTPYIAFGADISYALGQFLGIERLMMHMVDDPDWLHDLLAFLRDGILAVQQEAEDAGDFTAVSQHNQAETYSQDTVAPAAGGGPVTRKELWGFFAAQEFAGVSPAMHEEFLFRYQIPIMRRAGLVAYGCCEDLTRKIDMLRPLENLRRIAVSPWADLAECARQIEDRCVLSWRPNPAPMVCSGFEPAYVEKVLGEGLAACAGCHTDIILKDIQTVQGDPTRLRDWVKIVREVIS